MTTYEDLLIEADSNGLVTKEKDLRACDGRIFGNRIAIRKGLTEQEKKCVLAEELGHYYTGTGDMLDQSSVSNRKQERRGRIHAYNRLIGLAGIVEICRADCQSLAEAAEYLDVPEDFLKEALAYYKSKYGISTKFDNYIIFFEPAITILELA